LLQGVVPCARCRDAYDGQPVSTAAAQGKARAAAYDRGLGTDAYRFGGPRVGDHTQGRTDRLEAAVWRAGHGWLEHPEPLAQAYRRRLASPTKPGQGGGLALGHAQRGKWRQGSARLSDSDAEGRREKSAFAPRITRLKQRMAPLEAQAKQRADAAALQAELRWISGRLEDCVAQVTQGLDQADGRTRRERMRTVVKRVEVAHRDVKVVCRVDADPFVSRPGKKSLPDCGGRDDPTLRRPHLGRLPWALFHHSRFEPLPDQLQHPPIAEASSDQAQEQSVIDGVKVVLDIRVHHPPSPNEGVLDSFYGLVGTTLRSKAVGGVLEVGIEDGLDDQLARLLHHLIPDRGNP